MVSKRVAQTIAEEKGLETQARNAIRLVSAERDTKQRLADTRAELDALIVDLHSGGDGLSGGEIADLLGLKDRQIVHQRIRRHQKRVETTR